MLIHSFEALGFEVILRGRKHFSFQLNFLGHHKQFVVFINDKNPTLVQRKYHKQSPSKTYCFRWDQETEKYTNGRTYYEFESMTTQAIMQIVMDVVRNDENDYRSRLVANYKWKVDRRKYQIELRQSQLQEAAEKKRKALEQLLANRETLMTSAVEGMNHADQIRELIEIMQAKSQASHKPIKDFDRWVRWATHHANTLDPRYMSVQGFEAWVAKFKLKH